MPEAAVAESAGTPLGADIPDRSVRVDESWLAVNGDSPDQTCEDDDFILLEGDDNTEPCSFASDYKKGFKEGWEQSWEQSRDLSNKQIKYLEQKLKGQKESTKKELKERDKRLGLTDQPYTAVLVKKEEKKPVSEFADNFYAQRNTLVENLDSLQGQNKTLLQAKADLELRLKKLEARLEEEQGERAKKDKECLLLKRKSDGMAYKYDVLVEKLEKQKQMNLRTMEELDGSRRTIGNLRCELKAKDHRCKDLLGEIKLKEQAHLAVVKELDQSRQTSERLRVDLNATEDQCKEYISRLHDHDERLMSLRKQRITDNVAAKSKFAEYSGQLRRGIQ